MQDFYIDGPPTVAPSPLDSVSAYFGTYQKGKRTMFFNILDGISTLATALIPYSGPALKDAQIVLSGGLEPGHAPGMAGSPGAATAESDLAELGGLGDSGSGSAVSKFIYIQRKSQIQDPLEPISIPPRKTAKQISNIMGVEVSGFEIPDASAEQAGCRHHASPEAGTTLHRRRHLRPERRRGTDTPAGDACHRPGHEAPDHQEAGSQGQ